MRLTDCVFSAQISKYKVLLMEDLLAQVTKRAIRYINDMQTRRVNPSPEEILNLKRLDVPLQDQPIDPATVLAELDDIASPATVASTEGRFFGFVIGGLKPEFVEVSVANEKL